MKDGATLPPQLTAWVERFAADIPSADHPDHLEGVIDGIRLAANVPEVVQWFQQLHDAGRPLDTPSNFPTHDQKKGAS